MHVQRCACLRGLAAAEATACERPLALHRNSNRPASFLAAGCGALCSTGGGTSAWP